jgi:hypothetical protein
VQLLQALLQNAVCGVMSVRLFQRYHCSESTCQLYCVVSQDISESSLRGNSSKIQAVRPTIKDCYQIDRDLCQIDRTSVKLTETPVKLTEIVIKLTDIPIKLTEIPIKLTETSVALTTTPVKLTEIPVKLTEIPVKLTVTSVKLIEILVKLTGVPFKLTGSVNLRRNKYTASSRPKHSNLKVCRTCKVWKPSRSTATLEF